jgi:DNA polymerase-3 subunit beta
MKFKANSKSLEKLLAKVIPAIPTRTPMAIIENFLFEIEEGKLTVTATDLEITLRSSISVDADKNLKMVVPAKLTYDIVKSLGDTLIHFETDTNQKLKLKTDNGVYSIGFAEADEYPKIPEMGKINIVNLEGGILKKALDQTSFAISKEAMRPAMMGTFFEFSKDGLKFVTTDGHRLVKYLTKKCKIKSSEQCIVPERAISVLSKLVGDTEVKLFVGDSNIAFVMDDLELISRLIAQKYPDYNSVIPIENENLLKIKKGEVHSSIKRMLLFSTSNYQQVKLSIKENSIEISAEDIDHGSSAKENLTCEYVGDPMDIGFNTSYLNDILVHLDEGEIVFKLHSPTKACVIEPSAIKEDEELMLLLMPVRLNT